MMQKKKLVGLFILIAIGVILLMSCTTNRYGTVVAKEGDIEPGRRATQAQDAGEMLGDATISAAIRVKFSHDKMVSHSDIDVDTTDGHVTLSGAVAHRTEADRAMRLGRSVDGVKTVQSNLIVRSETK